MRRFALWVIIALAVILFATSFYMKNYYQPNLVLKTAVKETELTNTNYILCKRARTTGFDWLLIKNENGEKTDELCNINGPSPFDDYKLDYEFVMADNTFVFYVKEKQMKYSEAVSQDAIEFTVTGWDVLYPVKHSDMFDFSGERKYITENDLWKE